MHVTLDRPLHAPDGLTRRDALLAAALVPASGVAQVPGVDRDFWTRPRSVWLVRQQTSEVARAVYFADGKVQWPGYALCCHALRDVAAGVTAQIDLVLLDAICGAQGCLRAFGVDLPWVATSGYRTQRTNEHTEGAVKDSMHLAGRATDGHLPGINLEHQAALTRMYLRGGLGWYPSRGFIHLDTGRLRAWRG